MKRIGLIVNPVAGIGGKVGLKGSDGLETQKRALELGAMPESGEKALVTLKELKKIEDEIDLYTYPGEMGAELCERAGIGCHIIGKIDSNNTTQKDTIEAAKKLARFDLDLILFAGGDGTARDIMDAVKTDIPVLGIPTGCKIHSAVYALNPRSAGILVTEFVKGKTKGTKMAEVMDIDEKLFREGVVQAQLYGYLQIPNGSKMVQNLKSGRGFTEEGSIELIGNYLAENMDYETLYIVGTGSTTAIIMKKQNLDNTLLGVDLVFHNKTIQKDCTERQLLEALLRHPKAKILVTIIGGQGYIFGRGNQQISAEVIRKVGKDNIIVIASPDKMASILGILFM